MRGVGIGDTLAAIKTAYPKAIGDHSTDQTFRTTFVRIPKSGGGRLDFGVDVTTKRIVVIAVPSIATCE